MTRAKGVALEVGARFPAEPNEKIVVKNDGGLIRIVGDQVLVEFECPPVLLGGAP
jgi:hypothetical protein